MRLARITAGLTLADFFGSLDPALMRAKKMRGVMSIRREEAMRLGFDSYCIVKPRNTTVIEDFAVSELRKYLSLITGRDIQVKTEAQQRAIKVGCDFAKFVSDVEKLGENGFAIQREGANIIITSTSTKGVLNGVYHFLEMLGCRWFFPGQDGEFIPKTDAIALNDLSLDVRMSPSFPRITFFQDVDAYRDYSAEGLREVQAQNDMDLIIVFLVLQRYFVQGITMTGIKG